MQLLAALIQDKPLQFPFPLRTQREPGHQLPQGDRFPRREAGAGCPAEGGITLHRAADLPRHKGHLPAGCLLLGYTPSKGFLSLKEQLLAGILLSLRKRAPRIYPDRSQGAAVRGSQSHAEGARRARPQSTLTLKSFCECLIMKVTPLFSFVIFSCRSFAVTWKGDTKAQLSEGKQELSLLLPLLILGYRHRQCLSRSWAGRAQSTPVSRAQRANTALRGKLTLATQTTRGPHSAPTAQATMQRDICKVCAEL